jgi:Ca2+-dependent lipid-binding protein
MNEEDLLDETEKITNSADALVNRVRDRATLYANRAFFMFLAAVVIVLSYGAGFFRFKILFVVPLLVYTIWSIFQGMQEREHVRYTAHLHQVYRSATMNTDFEAAQWINTALARVWNVFEPVISARIIAEVQPVFDNLKFAQFVSHVELRSHVSSYARALDVPRIS